MPRPYKIVIGSGLFLLALSAAWHFTLSPRWLRRIQPGWSWKSTFVGTSTFADSATGKFPSKDPAVIQEKGIHPVKDTPSSSPVSVDDYYITRDPRTGQKTWEYVFQAQVDPVTGAHARPDFRGDIYVFPRSVRKQAYRLRWNYMKGVPLEFEREEAVEDLPAFVFNYKGPAEYTESYAGTKEYPGVKVAPGQTIACKDAQYSLRVWVEPLTGEILKMDEACPTGDYIHDFAGKPITAVLRWSAVTAGDDVVLRAGIIRGRKREFLWMVHYIPTGLAIAGLFLALGGMVLYLRRGQ